MREEVAAQGVSESGGWCLREHPHETAAGAWADLGGQPGVAALGEHGASAAVSPRSLPVAWGHGWEARRSSGTLLPPTHIAQHGQWFPAWVGSATYPVSLVGHTDLLPPPGPPEPNQAAVHARRPIQHTFAC